MDSFVNFKTIHNEDNFAVEFEVLPMSKETVDERQKIIAEGVDTVDNTLDALELRLEELNSELEKLTNHADGIDYVVAVGSGILVGIIDFFFVDDFSLEKANEWGDEKTNKFVVWVAQKKGYKGNELLGAVKYLEDRYSIAADKVTNKFGGGGQHHLRDFSHHATPIGLVFSLLTQFTHKVYGTDVAGRFRVVSLEEKYMFLIGKNLPEKITFGVINWFFHMISDVAGSNGSIRDKKVGTGLPGPIVSLLKEMSALPIFRSTNEEGYKEFSVWISKLFNGTLLGKRDENGKLMSPLKFDLRTEIGVMAQLGQQAVPVIINECIVRGFYFIRRFFMEIKNKKIHNVKDLQNIDWKNTLPFNNRTVSRMLTISTGTFVAVDVADAAIRSGGFNASCLLRVNFVGIGRFAIAIGTDVTMGIKKREAQRERSMLMSEIICLSNVKLYYKNADLMCSYSELYEKEATMHSAEADMWVEVDGTQQAMEELYEQIENVGKFYAKTIQAMDQNFDEIERLLPDVEKMNPGLVDEMLRRLQE